MTIFASPEIVAKLKDRTEAWKAVDFHGIDPLMKPIINILNDWEGLATAFCCEGHMEKDAEWDSWYIMFAVTEDKGFLNLKYLFEYLRDKIAEEADRTVNTCRPYDLSMVFTTRGFPTKDGGDYPVINLNMRRFRTQARKDQFFKILYEFFKV